MSVGWVDLSHILDLFAEGRKIEWLTISVMNELLLDQENQSVFWYRSKECQQLMIVLHKRDSDRRKELLHPYLYSSRLKN